MNMLRSDPFHTVLRTLMATIINPAHNDNETCRSIENKDVPLSKGWALMIHRSVMVVVGWASDAWVRPECLYSNLSWQPDSEGLVGEPRGGIFHFPTTHVIWIGFPGLFCPFIPRGDSMSSITTQTNFVPYGYGAHGISLYTDRIHWQQDPKMWSGGAFNFSPTSYPWTFSFMSV